MQKDECIYCNKSNIKKIGKRKNKKQIIQRYKCNECGRAFTLNQIKNKNYPIKIILNAITYYNLGYSQEQVSKLICKLKDSWWLSVG